MIRLSFRNTVKAPTLESWNDAYCISMGIWEDGEYPLLMWEGGPRWPALQRSELCMERKNQSEYKFMQVWDYQDSSTMIKYHQLQVEVGDIKF